MLHLETFWISTSFSQYLVSSILLGWTLANRRIISSLNFNLEYFIVIKNIFIVKNLTNFRKTVETGVDPRLKWAALLCWSRTGLNHRVCLLNFRTSGTWLRLNTSFQTNHVLNMFKEVFSQLLILKSTKTNKYTVKGIYLKGLRNTETNFNILCTTLFLS